MTESRPDKTLELISAAYGAAIEPENFDQLLSAWDVWCDDYLDDVVSAFEPLSPKFKQALSAAEQMEAEAPVLSAIDLTQAPMILLDATETVLTHNAAAASLVDKEQLDIAYLMQSRRRSDVAFGDKGLGTFRCNGTAGGRCYLAVEAPPSDAVLAEHRTASTLLILSLIDWDERFANDLRDRFRLSDAELRVAQGLLEGQTAQEISGALGRSLATIRSHIKALLTKSGARRQTELVQLLTILRQTGVGDSAEAQVVPDGADFRLEDWHGPGGTLSVVRYGQGQPALYFTTSSLPEETPEVRTAFAQAGFDVIAPARPGFRGKGLSGGDANDQLLDLWLDRLVASAAPRPVLIGHREGGILAAKAARRIIAQGGDIAGLAIISTGAPTRDFTAFETAPDTVRRSFRAGRYAQTALALGYQTAARVFRAGRFGEDKIIEYFFRDTPADAALMDVPKLRQTTRNNLAYCFADPAQISRDIKLWGDDWSPDLHAAASAAPVLFLHGDAHTFQFASDIADVVDELEGVQMKVFPEVAQLLLYLHSREISYAIREMLDLG